MKTITRSGLIAVAWAMAFPLCRGAVAAEPQVTVRERVAAYIEQLPADAGGAYGAVARWASEAPIELDAIKRDLEHVKRRRDCADFKVAGMLRLLYLDRNEARVPEEVREAITDALLNFKYWIDEPGHDSMCYWSENHQILYHSAEYLVGALFPERTFTNTGMTGEEHRVKGKALAERWLDWRERFGFSEWLSNCYYEEDFRALFNLADFAPDEAIARRAAMAIDQLLLNMALNSHRGNFTCTHGRSYERHMKSARGDAVKRLAYLVWGVRELTPDLRGEASAATSFATSKYTVPDAILAIGQDTGRTVDNYQIHGLPVDAVQDHGMDPNSLDTGMFFWGQGMYTHPDAINTTSRMWTAWDLYDNSFFMGFPRTAEFLLKLGLLDDLVRWVPFISSGTYLADAHTYTHRCPDYILSSVLDRYPGRMASQNLAWTAALGRDAVVFVTHPTRTWSGSPGYWLGNAANPRTAQYRNVLVALHNAPWYSYIGEPKRHPYTHAWFPRSEFEQVEQRGQWVFGKKGNGYLALYSHNPTRWQERGEEAGKELIAEGRRNVWVCEMGREADDGTFGAFMESRANAELEGDYRAIRYDSPSAGRVEFGWRKPFVVAGEEISLRRDFRYQNPYMRTSRFAERIEVNAGGYALVLDFAEGQRSGDGL